MSSRYLELFGEGRRGRPVSEDEPTGVATGDPNITKMARRRATRVLKAENRERFEDLMREEAEYLKSQDTSEVLPVGEG
jgi:hypothetical protein